MLILRRRNSRRASMSYCRMSTPSTRIAPLVGSIRRLKWRTSVDLPEPDRPMITKISPLPMLRDKSFTPTTQPVSDST
ncbi:hypothetical protein D9M73_190840 [compost metagenome]